MASGAPGAYERRLDDYVDVAERMREFYEKYPDGSLRAADPAHPWELAIVSGNKKDGTPTTQTFVVYSALAYRRPDDPAPGVGVAWEIFPGRTPYTLGSELMNAETSAWGRAMAALGIATKRGIASRQEVQSRRAERDDGLPVNADGSLSRSRTSDAEKDAAGVMTSAQQAEHTALRPKPAETRGRVVHLGVVPDDDPYYGQPPELEDKPGTITPGQSRSMHAHFKALLINNRDERLAITKGLLGLDTLESSSDLTYRQAGDLLERLASADPADRMAIEAARRGVKA